MGEWHRITFYVNIGGPESGQELWVDPEQVVAIKPGERYTRVFLRGAHSFDTRTDFQDVLEVIERSRSIPDIIKGGDTGEVPVDQGPAS